METLVDFLTLNPGSKCTACEHVIQFATGFRLPPESPDFDVLTCFNCGHLMTFAADGKPRNLTSHEKQRLPTLHYADGIRAQQDRITARMIG